MVSATILLLMNGFFLSFILLILILVLASQKKQKVPAKSRVRVKSDLKKIKEQINSDE